MTYSDPSFWKWVCGALITLVASNGFTAFWFSAGEKEIQQAVKRSFTDVSNQHGMYAIEGRPRLATLEQAHKTIQSELKGIQSALARIEAKLVQ